METSSTNKEGEMAVQVTELREQVRQRGSELEAVHGEIRSIRETIQKESKDRQNFMLNVFRVDEAAELVTDHQQLGESLVAKQTQLRSLHQRSAQKQRELERMKEEVEELQKVQLRVSGLRELDTLTVEELKRQEKQVKQFCTETTAILQNVREELDKRKEKEETTTNSKPHTPRRKPLSVRLDQFIITTCKKAGLQL